MSWDASRHAIWPVDDLRPHEPRNPNCWCKPTLQHGLLVHNSMDGREKHEEDGGAAPLH